MDEFDDDAGIIPDGMISIEEYAEELEGDVELSHTIIILLQARLEEAGINSCICNACIEEYRAEMGEDIQ